MRRASNAQVLCFVPVRPTNHERQTRSTLPPNKAPGTAAPSTRTLPSPVPRLRSFFTKNQALCTRHEEPSRLPSTVFGPPSFLPRLRSSVPGPLSPVFLPRPRSPVSGLSTQSTSFSPVTIQESRRSSPWLCVSWIQSSKEEFWVSSQ